MARRKKKTDCSIQEFEEIEECCFTNEPPAGKPIAYFSFDKNTTEDKADTKAIDINATNN